MLLSLAAAALSAGLTVVAPRAAARQPFDEAGDAGGVTFAPLSFAPSVALPNPSDLVIERFALAPGASFPFAAAAPRVGIILLELGVLKLQVDGTVRVTRDETIKQVAAEGQTAAKLTAASKRIPAGRTVRLLPGDAAFVPANVNGELRNDSRLPAVGLVFVATAPANVPTAPAPPG
jgi:quercetin dioxygenase-like cupin family protein